MTHKHHVSGREEIGVILFTAFGRCLQVGRNRPNPAFAKDNSGREKLTFLRLNGRKFTASESEIAALLIDTANHELSEDQLIHWFKQRTE